MLIINYIDTMISTTNKTPRKKIHKDIEASNNNISQLD